jgi:hypothetical protein
MRILGDWSLVVAILSGFWLLALGALWLAQHPLHWPRCQHSRCRRRALSMRDGVLVCRHHARVVDGVRSVIRARMAAYRRGS